MPRPSADGLPLEVRFAKWEDYQHKRATRFVRLFPSFLYDERIGRTDLARSMFASGIVLAGMGHGRVSVGAWIGQAWDKKRARLQIKCWLANGLLLEIGLQSRVGKIRVETTSDATASGVSGETRKQRQKPRTRVEPKPSWLAPFAGVVERGMGPGSFDYGRWAAPLRDLKAANGEAEVLARLERYAADTKLNGVRSPRHFQTNFAAYSGAPPPRDSDDMIAASIKRRLAPGPQFPNNWDVATATDDEKRVFAARGGAHAIWNAEERRR